MRKLTLLLVLVLLAALALSPAAAQDDAFVIGLLMVGPYNDNGWSQAHYDAVVYVTENLENTQMIYLDRVNPADRQGTTPDQLAEELLDQGADMIIFNSDDMKDGATTFATNHPEIPVIHASGDQRWEEGENFVDLPNLGNAFPGMEWTKLVAGCAAAMTTETGKIGYLGPLINDETRRLTASAFLGAQYCWTEKRGMEAADLEFRVDWIGFWFNIPGVTADPTLVSDNFYNNGYDVVISGIDTTEGLVQANAAAEAGATVFNVAYDYDLACEIAPDVCLGSAVFNWRPMYLAEITEMQAGTWTPKFLWPQPDYANYDDVTMNSTYFIPGTALSEEAAAALEELKSELAGGLDLWAGPINLQDGTPYIADGETATLEQLWYLPQLLEGMDGQSVPE
ncbi:MAG: BMP family ABC transporter substrate-binding protein [Anaerolineae bacterium]|nr:BMP family ABC transporter substrate-binding protein [Anaerolineae bacterium]